MEKRKFNGLALRAARRAKKMRQQELATAIGKSRNIISRAETENSCSPATALACAKVLDQDVNSFYEERPAPPQTSHLGPKERQIVEAIRRCPTLAGRLLAFIQGYEARACDASDGVGV